MPAPRQHPQELRERAIRLVQKARREDQGLSLDAAVIRIGQRTGVNAETPRGCGDRAQVGAGLRPRVSSNDAKRTKELETEVRELERDNEILLATS